MQFRGSVSDSRKTDARKWAFLPPMIFPALFFPCLLIAYWLGLLSDEAGQIVFFCGAIIQGVLVLKRERNKHSSDDRFDEAHRES
jgi:hypothetical protein